MSGHIAINLLPNFALVINLSMKKILLIMAAFNLLSFTYFTELPIGADLPMGNVKLNDISGKAVSLKEAARKNGLLVMFSCNTCPVVIKNQGRTKEICQYALNNDIGVVLINSNEAERSDGDSYAAMQEYAKRQAYSWYYLVDQRSAIADAFGASRTPENFLFSKEGKLIYHGAIDNSPTDPSRISRKHLKEAIDEMLQGKEITIKTSRSVGCAIKRM
jgi:thioredoxin-related protein